MLMILLMIVYTVRGDANKSKDNSSNFISMMNLVLTCAQKRALFSFNHS
mgnify:CR=1 FL=1|jgi:hypothetical protein